MSLTETQLRSVVQDAAGANQILSSTDYTNAIALESNNYRQIALVCNMISAAYAGKVEMSAGTVRIANHQKFEHYRNLAKEYNLRAQTGGGSGSLAPESTGLLLSEIALVESDTDTKQASFTQSMQSTSFAVSSDEDYA